METINPLHLLFSVLGGTSKVARMCGVAQPVAWRWKQQGHLPRTEWTGETNYAERIEIATNGLVTKAQLLAQPPTSRHRSAL